MAISTRSIVIKNTDSLIAYQPENAWTDVSSSNAIANPTGNLDGWALSGSLKTIQQSGSFSFSFNGSSIDVYGLSDILFDCTVDGMTIMPNFTAFGSNNRLCSSGTLEVGQHMFSINIQPYISEALFFFDYLTFVPASDDQRSNGSIRIDRSDSSIFYSGNWSTEPIIDSPRLTNQNGASVKIFFIGQQLSWYGAFSDFLNSFPFASTQAEFSVDGGPPTHFELAGLVDVDDSPSTPALSFSQLLLFQTDNLIQGTHEVTVTYLGNSDQQADLSLDFVVVQNASEKAVTPVAITTTSLINFTSTPMTTVSSKSRSSRPLIIGVTVGATLLLIIVLTAIFVFKRRRSRHANPVMSGATDVDTVPSLIVASPTGVDTASSHPERTTSDECVTRSINTQVLGTSLSDSTGEDAVPPVPSPAALQVPSLPTDPFDDEHLALTEPRISDFPKNTTGTSTQPVRPIRPLPNPLLGPGTARGMDNEDSGVRLKNVRFQ